MSNSSSHRLEAARMVASAPFGAGFRALAPSILRRVGGLATFSRIRRASTASCFVLALVLGSACGSQPVPKVVLEGTSLTVILPGDNQDPGTPTLQMYNVGFGGEWAWNSGLRDVQRGEIQFFIDSTANLLETDFVSRVVADPASDIAINNDVIGGGPWGISMGVAQVQALVFVPCGTPTGLGELKARKVYRDSNGDLTVPANFETTLSYVEQIYIEDDPNCSGDDNRSTPHLGYGDDYMAGLWSDDEAAPFAAYPHPKLVYALPSDPDLPAAAHLEVGVPSTVTVMDVVEEQHSGRRSLISWRLNGAGDTVEIDFMNPDDPPDVDRIAIVFRPESGYVPIFTGLPNFESLVATFFPVYETNNSYWDKDGNLLSGSLTLVTIR